MTTTCKERGNEMQIGTDGVSNHLTEGDIGYDMDADHVALSDNSDSEKGKPLLSFNT